MNRPDWTLFGIVTLLSLMAAFVVVGVLMSEGVL